MKTNSNESPSGGQHYRTTHLYSCKGVVIQKVTKPIYIGRSHYNLILEIKCTVEMCFIILLIKSLTLISFQYIFHHYSSVLSNKHANIQHSINQFINMCKYMLSPFVFTCKNIRIQFVYICKYVYIQSQFVYICKCRVHLFTFENIYTLSLLQVYTQSVFLHKYSR